MIVPCDKILATFSFTPDVTVEPLAVIQMWVDGETRTEDLEKARSLVCLNSFGVAIVADPDEGYLRRLN